MRDIVLPVSDQDLRIARLSAIAIGLTLAEAALPSPIPGVKPGLANIVILLVLLQQGFSAAAWVSIIRLLAGSLLLGSFLSPGFWLAAAGTAASLMTLSLVRHLPAKQFGPVSLSILAAFAHVSGQLALAWVWFLPGAALAGLLPVFAFSALVFGTVNGLIVARLIVGNTVTAHIGPCLENPLPIFDGLRNALFCPTSGEQAQARPSGRDNPACQACSLTSRQASVE